MNNILLNTLQGIFLIPSPSEVGSHLQLLEIVGLRASDPVRQAVTGVRVVR